MKPANHFRSPVMPVAALLCIAILHFLTMPKFNYPGDSTAIKTEATHIIKTGRIGIGYNEKEIFQETQTLYRGQYFFENDRQQKGYSKYGLFYSLCSIPPLMLKKLLTGELDYFEKSDELIFIYNCYYILLSLIYVSYLYNVFSLFNENRRQLSALILVSIYCSYNWYYLRAPDKEIFQMISFTAAIYHALRFMSSNAQEATARKQLTLALAWAGFTYLLKPLYALLVIIIAVFAGWQLHRDYRSAPDACLASGSQWRNTATVLPAMLLLIMAISFTHNYLRCDNILISGYGQDSYDPVEFTFTIDHFLGGLATYFLKPGNGNWFLHQPLLLLALGGYAAFYRSYRTEALFLLSIIGVHLLVLCFHTEWIGEWCYGPRFCLHLIMCATIPAALGIKKLLIKARERKGQLIRGIAIFTFSALALISLRAQIYVNSWFYFTFHFYSARFEKFEPLYKYFSEMPHRAVLNRDLALYRDQGKLFPLLTTLNDSDLPTETKKSLYALTDEIIQKAEWNYMLLPKPNS